MSRIQPAVSVLMPAFNAERYLASAIESILRQSFLNFELLVIDDGSTDGSRALLARYARTDSRFRLISRPNTGLVPALEELRSMARGRYIARMDADDIAMPRRLEQQVARLDSDPALACLGGAVQFVDEHGHVVLSPEPATGDAAVQSEALAGRTPICHPACMMRADAIERAGGYHEDAYPAEDLDLFLRLGEVGTLDNLTDVLLAYRVHAHSISVTKRRRQLDMMKQACERAWKRRGLRDQVFAPAEDPAAVAERLTGRNVLEIKPDGALATVLGNPTACALASSAEPSN